MRLQRRRGRFGRVYTALVLLLVILGVVSIGVMAWNTYRANISITDRLTLHKQGDKLDVLAATAVIESREARIVADAQAVVIADLVRRVAALEGKH